MRVVVALEGRPAPQITKVGGQRQLNEHHDYGSPRMQYRTCHLPLATQVTHKTQSVSTY